MTDDLTPEERAELEAEWDRLDAELEEAHQAVLYGEGPYEDAIEKWFSILDSRDKIGERIGR